MTAVFVHGVPETGRIWDGVRELVPGSISLGLPGFGRPTPEGFSATKDAYAEWLEQRLRQVDGPIDLVGHDWGSLLALRIASATSVPLRSWAADIVSCYQPDYVWHAAARTWQTPGEGEAALADATAAPPDSPKSFPGRLRNLAVPPALAEEIGAANDETMNTCILALYRSSVPNLHADWGADLPAARRAPGLVVIPTADPFNDPVLSGRTAETAGARVVRPEGLGHAWMAQDPRTAADLLREFWASVPS
ncbi:alpha/beta fold hydrolase [Umezawaea sp. NPDC059074]|uniref:alpha/beta fold hydrolase n=1 Tax=Umezawaea sp. NPDC059074 TaxID=3346716 RepID=UPI00368D4855